MTPFRWTEQVSYRGKRQWLLFNPDVEPSPLVPTDGDHRLGIVTHEGGRVWRATYWRGYQSVKFDAGSPGKAARLLEAEIGRRAPEWFGVDVIEFEGSPK